MIPRRSAPVHFHRDADPAADLILERGQPLIAVIRSTREALLQTVERLLDRRGVDVEPPRQAREERRI
jgi:hypothetical protein